MTDAAGGMTAARKTWAWAPLILAFLPAMLLLWLVIRAGAGHFVYTLDDPYIHLGLARNILHGSYGLNPGELAAPSSSIVWPFLIAPFALLPQRAFELAPLALNLGFLAGSQVLIQRLMPAGFSHWVSLAATILLSLSLNLYGLVFTGMEHSLQMLLVLLALEGFFARPDDGSQRPVRFYVALAILPLVRYEGLALTASLLGYQFLRGDRRNTVLAGMAALAGVVLFSLFLLSLGFGVLPTSVIAKSTMSGDWALASSMFEKVRTHRRLMLGAAILLLLIVRRAPLMGGVLIGFTLLHLVLGQFGWFGRYEVYWLATLVIVAIRMVPSPVQRWVAASLVLLPLLFSDLRNATLQTPGQAQSVYAQHVQMDRIASLLDRPVAVNDIGIVTLHSRHYVLDLFGLASREALRLRQGNPGTTAWAGPLLERRGVRHAMIYETVFPGRPANWIKVGTLSMIGRNFALGGSEVALFATDPAAASQFRQALAAYQACCATPLTTVDITSSPEAALPAR